MHLWLLGLLFLTTSAFANIGFVTKIAEKNDAYIMREGQKFKMYQNQKLKAGDIISSQNNTLVVYLHPGTQVSFAKKTEITLTKHRLEETKTVKLTTSLIDYSQGIIRVQVQREEGEEIELTVRVNQGEVSFAVQGTEFEVSKDKDQSVSLNVIEGEVGATSPDIHTFVPEVVKKKEGFSFNKQKRAFSKKKFQLKFKDHPGFDDHKVLRDKWLNKKESKKEIKKKAKKKIQKKSQGR